MQRASPASSRCSGVQASSAGIGEPPLSLVAAPSRSTETANENDLARDRHRGNLHSRHGARDPRRHRLHGPARARRGAPRRTRAEARRPAARGAGGARRRRARRCASPTPATRARCATRSRVQLSSRRCAGPFLELGLAPVEAAVGERAHYLDTTGEQAFVRLVHDRVELRHGSSCRHSASTTCQATWPRGSLPSRSTARSTRSSSRTPSRGSARAAARGARSARSWARIRSPGRTAGSCRPASARRRARCASRSARAPSSSGAAPSRSPSRGTPMFATCAPTSGRRRSRRRPAGSAGSRRRSSRLGSRFGPSGPSEESRSKSRFAVVAEARGRGGEGRAVLTGSDVYGLTALLIVRGAQALLAGEARGTGVLAPAEAFDARTLVATLEPYLTIARADVVRSASYGEVRATAQSLE